MTYFLFRLLIFIFRIIPFWLLYRLSDLAYLLIYKILAYRTKVVRTNLKNAFPEKTATELLQIEKKFYQHLFDILLESIKGLSMSKKSLMKRLQLGNHVAQETLKNHQSIIIIGGHYGNWEWAGISATFYFDEDIIILYSPLKNKAIDSHLKKSRGVYNTYFTVSQSIRQVFDKYKEKKAVFVMIADQSPSNPKKAYWHNFFHQNTPFFRGAANYAVDYNMPIVYIDIKRKKRGFYTMELELLVENPSLLSREEISALYVKKLEDKIKEKPELWLWSHRRWKHKKE